MRRLPLLPLLLAGCASGTPPGQGGSDAVVPPDRPSLPDAPALADAPPVADAPSVTDAPAVVDARPIDGATPDAPAMVDARPVDGATPDAPAMTDGGAPSDACVPVTTELLANPAFDLSPRGTGWTEMPLTATPIITSAAGNIAAHTVPNRAWMGNAISSGGITTFATDLLYQDVVVPPGTTRLTMSGRYAIFTAETLGFAVDDVAVELRSLGGVRLEKVLTLDNNASVSTWTAFSHVVAASLAGQTIRVQLKSSNDYSEPTSFYFDSLSLAATHCP